jgi:hypothetical protein
VKGNRNQPDSELFKAAFVKHLDYFLTYCAPLGEDLEETEEDPRETAVLDAISALEQAEGPEAGDRLFVETQVKSLIDMNKLGLAYEFIKLIESHPPVDPGLAEAFKIFRELRGWEQ